MSDIVWISPQEHYGREINPPHLTRCSTLHLIWAKHAGAILLFDLCGLDTLMQLPESPQLLYAEHCAVYINIITLASNL